MFQAARGWTCSLPKDHNVRRFTLLTLLSAALLAALTGLVGVAPASATTTREARMIAKINYARATHGLPPLYVSRDLTTAARTHSASMASSNLLFHSSTLTSLCCYRLIAENVGEGGTLSIVHSAFMNSAPHRANILNARVGQVGVGVVSAGGQLWITEVFRQHS
jgi:uncharacterized protein YkwD